MGYSFGVEHEWADWDITTKLPFGCTHNKKDGTIVNSNGIANDPSGKSYRFGGEINTPPTDTYEGQIEILESLLHFIPTATINYRSNLHLHVHVPGLRDNLILLKRIQQKISNELPFLIDFIEPIPRPTTDQFPIVSEYKGALVRYKRCLRSHHTFPRLKGVEAQMEATNVKDFFNFEAPKSVKGRYLHHLVPRACVNIRQLLETNTIEFRHFPGTMNSDELRDAFKWCVYFLEAAINDFPLEIDYAESLQLPKFQHYKHSLECGYRATTFHPSSEKARLTRIQIENNIQRILTEGVEVFYV